MPRKNVSPTATSQANDLHLRMGGSVKANWSQNRLLEPMDSGQTQQNEMSTANAKREPLGTHTHDTHRQARGKVVRNMGETEALMQTHNSAIDPPLASERKLAETAKVNDCILVLGPPLRKHARRT